MRQQTFDYDIGELSREAERDYYAIKQKVIDSSTVKRNELYFSRRYRLNSYKAIKLGISTPSVMMKYKGDKVRLFGSPENNKLFAHCKTILAGWKARSKAEMKLLKRK
ncbi:hypothetical protein M0R04_08275 [Candidatus Dojkabacteria bacterium]|jgi:hypothetical protein|nr:hypothetical protein [Candidatus Dojkabacteria bacterium]